MCKKKKPLGKLLCQVPTSRPLLNGQSEHTIVETKDQKSLQHINNQDGILEDQSRLCIRGESLMHNFHWEKVDLSRVDILLSIGNKRHFSKSMIILK